MTGPLAGVQIIEMAAIGPVPFCATLLADLGADVTRVDRVAGGAGALPEPLLGAERGRRSIAVDLKTGRGRDVARRLVSQGDVLLEGFRPGVMERLGLGPEDCLSANPGLVYGRMTGWGRDGPLAETAGHDINYLALAGALHGIGPVEEPIPPLNLVADYGGGALYLALGVLAALIERQRSGLGQVVDAAMIDGAASLMSIFYRLHATGFWEDRRRANLLDGAAPFYRAYRTADGEHVAVGALEPQFYRELVAGLGIDPDSLPPQMDRERWPETADRFAAVFAGRSRREWEEIFAGTDACVTPVLSLAEAPVHPHNVARATFIRHDATAAPAPAPRFGRSRPVPAEEATGGVSDATAILEGAGFTAAEVAALCDAGIVA